MDFAYLGYLAGGLVLLIIGGSAIVRGAVTLAGRLGLSTLFLGLVVVSVGTSAPELAVSVDAVFGGQTDIAVGNIVGSNIANILLILGLGAVLSPIAAEKNVVFRDGVALLVATLMLAWLGTMGGSIERSMGVLMIALLLIYLTWAYFSERVHPSISGDRAYELAERSRMHIPSILLDVGVIIIGFVAIKFGADLLIDGAVTAARDLGVDEAMIGVTVVALGTSLPELAMVTMAAVRRQTEMAVGAVVGSNVFNILAVLGVTSILRPIEIDPSMANYDLPVMLVATIIMSFFLLTNCRLSRFEGLLLVIGYIGYITLRFNQFGGM